MSLAGKTIDRVEERKYGGQRVWFTDGSAADFEACGYEVEGVEIDELAPEAIEAERVEAIQKAYRDQAERERHARIREAKRAEMELLLTPKQYQRWLAERDTPTGFAAVMQQEMAANLRMQRDMLARMVNGA